MKIPQKLIFILVYSVLLSYGFIINHTYQYKIGKTTCVVEFNDDYSEGICYWSNGITTTLKLVNKENSEYTYFEYKNNGLYTGKFWLYAHERGTYTSDCPQCNGKEYFISWIN
jgi:hypothetical protein